MSIFNQDSNIKIKNSDGLEVSNLEAQAQPKETQAVNHMWLVL